MSRPAHRVLIVGSDSPRASVLEAGLREAGIDDVIVVRDVAQLRKHLVTADPDVIFIDVQHPTRDSLDAVCQLVREVKLPVALFVDQTEAGMIDTVVAAGVGAYVVDGLRKERVKSVLDLCISRFKSYAALHGELEQVRESLRSRKLIDRAKGILMKERGLDEAKAYDLLRKQAMDGNVRLADVAQSVITAASLLA
jgi:response regulator NasT